MKKIIYGLFLLLCFFIISCDGDITISLYSNDLSDVASSKEKVLYTNVNMIVESLTDEKDINYLRNNLNGFSNENIVKYNYSDSLSFDIQIPIVKEGTTDIDFSKDLFIIISKSYKEKTDYYLKFNKELYSRINSYFYNAHYQKIDIENFKLKLEINNDERKQITFTSYSAYINGKTYPFAHEETLGARNRISLQVSEIFTKYITEADKEDYPLFSIGSHS